MALFSTENGSERKIKHYSSSHKILIVGDGDFSFSACLARTFGSAFNMVATSLNSREEVLGKYRNAARNLRELEERGCCILHGVNASTMSLHPLLYLNFFDRIIFNFPHAGFPCNEKSDKSIKRHQAVVRGFLRSAREMVSSNGEIHITHKKSHPFSMWGIEKLGNEVGLSLIEKAEFRLSDYPGYENKKGDGTYSDGTFPIGESSTFKFAKRLPNEFIVITQKPHMACSNFENKMCKKGYHLPESGECRAVSGEQWPVLGKRVFSCATECSYKRRRLETLDSLRPRFYDTVDDDRRYYGDLAGTTAMNDCVQTGSARRSFFEQQYGEYGGDLQRRFYGTLDYDRQFFGELAGRTATNDRVQKGSARRSFFEPQDGDYGCDLRRRFYCTLDYDRQFFGELAGRTATNDCVQTVSARGSFFEQQVGDYGGDMRRRFYGTVDDDRQFFRERRTTGFRQILCGAGFLNGRGSIMEATCGGREDEWWCDQCSCVEWTAANGGTDLRWQAW